MQEVDSDNKLGSGHAPLHPTPKRYHFYSDMVICEHIETWAAIAKMDFPTVDANLPTTDHLLHSIRTISMPWKCWARPLVSRLSGQSFQVDTLTSLPNLWF